MTRNKNKKTQKAFSIPKDMGLPDTIKTRSLKIIDFVNNDKIIKNDNQGKTILAHLTGISKDDFINTETFCKRLKELFDPGEIFYNHIPKESEQEPFTFAETKELFHKAKKGSKLFRKELSKNNKIDLKYNDEAILKTITGLFLASYLKILCPRIQNSRSFANL